MSEKTRLVSPGSTFGKWVHATTEASQKELVVMSDHVNGPASPFLTWKSNGANIPLKQQSRGGCVHPRSGILEINFEHSYVLPDYHGRS